MNIDDLPALAEVWPPCAGDVYTEQGTDSVVVIRRVLLGRIRDFLGTIEAHAEVEATVLRLDTGRIEDLTLTSVTTWAAWHLLHRQTLSAKPKTDVIG